MEDLSKKYRHESNPEEKLFHDTFIRENERDGDYAMIGLPTVRGMYPSRYLTDAEKQIMINTIQWLGSPIGRNFLKECGYVKQD